MRGEDILNVLLDVEWVVGSFVADAAGQLLVYQMPPEFGETELKRTTVRLASILRCAELCELGVEQCALSLNRYQLLMSRFRNGFLCVMVEAPVNRRALEMATRIALECLPALVDSLAAGPPGSEQTQAERALAQSLEPSTELPSSEPEPVPDPERATERPPSDSAGSDATALADDDLSSNVSRGLAGRVIGHSPGQLAGNGTSEPRNREDDRVN